MTDLKRASAREEASELVPELWGKEWSSRGKSQAKVQEYEGEKHCQQLRSSVRLMWTLKPTPAAPGGITEFVGSLQGKTQTIIKRGVPVPVVSSRWMMINGFHLKNQMAARSNMFGGKEHYVSWMPSNVRHGEKKVQHRGQLPADLNLDQCSQFTDEKTEVQRQSWWKAQPE